MKKLLSLLLVLLPLLFLLSCGDDPASNLPPSVSTSGVTNATAGGDAVNITFTITAEAGYASSSASASAGTASISSSPAAGEASGTIVVSYTPGAAAGAVTVTVIVVDSDSQSGSQNATVNVTEEPAPDRIDIFATEDGIGGAAVTWTKDNIYILRGFVFVNDGQVLTIEPGTVVKGQPGQGAGASALIVARGGQLIAEGTADEPIIFTGLADDLAGSVADDANGLWGGLIMLGNAGNNANSTNNLLAIEGIPESEPRGTYGPDGDFPLDADDISGSLKYVSIRHGGSLIGSDNEINGLTLGSVGAGTTIENIEIIANLDDGVEIFGGSVNLKNMVIALCGDDGIDLDNGWVGTIQNVIAWNAGDNLESSDPSGAEMDGATGDDEGTSGTPYATPKLANITWVFDEGASSLTQALHIRDNFGGSIYNSILVGHDAPITIEETSKTSSSWDLFVDGTIEIENNIIFNVNDASDLTGTVLVNGSPADAADFGAYIAAKNTMVDPGFGTGIARFTPSASEVTADALSTLSSIDAFLEDEAYIGAIDPAASSLFFEGWTLTSQVVE
ncbi:MAG: hypothetical protein O2887_17040 [Bacteroidetes bacterium]|nr:hypothetical protein [Bacteroidota bacterium]MDA1122167.1 hypothetical protein [Bacteroidota bacterium]